MATLLSSYPYDNASTLRLQKKLSHLVTRNALRHDLEMLHVIFLIAVALLAFVLAASSDWLETRYVRSVREWEDGDDRARYRAANFSCGMLVVGGIGLYACVEIGWWVLLPELLGLRVGTLLALRR